MFLKNSPRGKALAPSITALLTILCLTGTAAAEDDFFAAPLDKSQVSSVPSEIAQPNKANRMRFSSRGGYTPAGYPRIVLDAPGEAYLFCDGGAGMRYYYAGSCSSPWIAVRSAQKGDLTGKMIQDTGGKVVINRLKVPREDAAGTAKSKFLGAKRHYYDFLIDSGAAGTAWFKRQRDAAVKELGSAPAARGVRPPVPREVVLSQLERNFNLLSGGRALSENLQLDRDLFFTSIAEDSVAVDSIEGVTVTAFDWKPLLTNPAVKLDALARQIPADQYALFAPSFTALDVLMDEAHKSLGEALRAFEPRSEFVNTRERYQTQLCLPIAEFTKALARVALNDIAITGSDTFFRTGTDVAVLLRADAPALVLAAVLLQQDACFSSGSDRRRVTGTIEGVAYRGVVNLDRSISTYAAEVDGTVVVTNSIFQLERIIKVGKTQAPALAGLDEYRFFRTRYQIGDPDEHALLIVSDAAIRKWTGPRWRVLASRRTVASSELNALHAEHYEALVKADGKERNVGPSDAHRVLGNFVLTPKGIRSEVYGTLEFLTPVSELPLEKVSTLERDAYVRFRDTYSRYWKNYLDPIAIRIRKNSETLELDTTVIPLILGTDYATLRDLTGSTLLDKLSGDPHKESILELTTAIDMSHISKNPQAQFAGNFLPGLAQPFSWIGASATLSVDGGAFWEKLSKSSEPEQFLEKNYPELPVTLFIEVKDSLKLAAFMAAVRGFAEQGAPGLVKWEPRTYNEQPYTAISEAERPQARTTRSQDRAKWVLCYAATPEALIVTLGEDTLKRALDRLNQRNDRPETLESKFQVGSHASVKVRREFLEPGGVFDDSYVDLLQDRCWGNIPILNEWKRLFPDKDPVEVHRTLWKTTPVCHAGGGYQWNAEWQTMESTLFGNPAAPREVRRSLPGFEGIAAARFALQFEHDGLRAKVAFDRKE